MSADEELLYCAVCLHSGTAAQIAEHLARAHPVSWAAALLERLNARQPSAPEPRRELQKALAASQADLTRALAERDLARAEVASARIEIDHLKAELRLACALLPANPPANRGRA